MSLEKGSMLFAQSNYLVSAEKNKVRQKYKKNRPTKQFKASSRHPNFMSPFEYVQSFHNKSFPKRIGTLTPPNPKIFRGTQCAPPPLVLAAIFLSKKSGGKKLKLLNFL